MRRGLEDHDPRTAEAATQLLLAWKDEHCDGDIFQLLQYLDCEAHAGERASLPCMSICILRSLDVNLLY